MTRDEAIEKHKHTFEGMLLDAWNTHRSGAEAMSFIRKVDETVVKLMGCVFDEGFREAQEDAARLNKPAEKRELPGFNKKGRSQDAD